MRKRSSSSGARPKRALSCALRPALQLMRWLMDAWSHPQKLPVAGQSLTELIQEAVYVDKTYFVGLIAWYLTRKS